MGANNSECKTYHYVGPGHVMNHIFMHHILAANQADPLLWINYFMLIVDWFAWLWLAQQTLFFYDYVTVP